MNPRTPTRQAPEACAFDQARQPLPFMELSVGKGLRVTVCLIAFLRCVGCLRMDPFRRLVRYGLRLLRFSLLLRRALFQGLGLNVTMRSGLFCSVNLDRTGFSPFSILVLFICLFSV